MYYTYEQINRECQWWEHIEKGMEEDKVDQISITFTKADIRKIIIMLKS